MGSDQLTVTEEPYFVLLAPFLLVTPSHTHTHTPFPYPIRQHNQHIKFTPVRPPNKVAATATTFYTFCCWHVLASRSLPSRSLGGTQSLWYLQTYVYTNYTLCLTLTSINRIRTTKGYMLPSNTSLLKMQTVLSNDFFYQSVHYYCIWAYNDILWNMYISNYLTCSIPVQDHVRKL